MTTAGEMLTDGAPGRGRWRRRLLVAVLIVVCAGIIAELLYVVVRSRSFFAISPGTAPVVSDKASCRAAPGGNYTLPGGQPCVRLVLPAAKAASVNGSVMMVDVLEGKATPWQYFLYQIGLLHRAEDGTVLLPNQEILGPTPPSQLGCQGNQQMADATQAARVVALRQLGYTVKQTDLGAQIDEVGTGTPAASAGLQCDDLVVGLNGAPVRSASQLVAAIHALAPGDVARLSVRRVVGGRTQTLQLSARLSGTPALGGQPADPRQAFLGVALETRAAFTYPFQVSFQVGPIGGPSAGLAMTLGVLDALTHGQLTGGLRVAATGTMDFRGDVGDVGGVAQKTVAVRHAGAQIFFVPISELATARSEAGPMKVYAVSTLAQTLTDLRELGGHVPAVPSGQNGAG